ncbi:MOSC domain-containing protein [Novosphingobium sp. PS1R-30]|uniref:MOSC domain-containing protein n=1 Tax=Novosphingobium anseongense TaxID=3133436 RepID=A0ABU8RY19_9SPHN
MIRVDDVLIGAVRPLGPKGIASGIAKQAVDRQIRLETLGFVGDEQGDTRHHGGPDKAVHHYPQEHYAAWRDEVEAVDLLARPGAFGENVATSGLTENEVAVGDRFRLGTALVEVSQGRQPCFRLNLRFGVKDMALRMQQSGRTGWYYRVIEPGLVAPGDALELVERRAPDWTIARLWRLLYVDVLDREALAAMIALEHLPERWREIGQARLQRGEVEDWDRRLKGE